MKEIWIDIEGFESLYQISNFGQVKNVRPYKNTYLKQTTDSLGYCQVTLSKDGKKKNFRVHRLVANHFLHKIESKRIINHIDGDKKNNCTNNLEWSTHSDNVKHAHTIGLKVAVNGENHGMSKITIRTAKTIKNLLKKGYAMTEISKKLKVSYGIVSKIKQGQTWNHVLK